jgi:hypothetical protein
MYHGTPTFWIRASGRRIGSGAFDRDLQCATQPPACDLPDFLSEAHEHARITVYKLTDQRHLEHHSPTYTPWAIAAAKRTVKVEAVGASSGEEEEATSKAKGGRWEMPLHDRLRCPSRRQRQHRSLRPYRPTLPDRSVAEDWALTTSTAWVWDKTRQEVLPQPQRRYDMTDSLP